MRSLLEDEEEEVESTCVQPITSMPKRSVKKKQLGATEVELRSKRQCSEMPCRAKIPACAQEKKRMH